LRLQSLTPDEKEMILWKNLERLLGVYATLSTSGSCEHPLFQESEPWPNAR
jgi:hypothetical protein